MPKKTFTEHEVTVRRNLSGDRLTFVDPPPEIEEVLKRAGDQPISAQAASNYVSFIVPHDEAGKRAAMLRTINQLRDYLKEIA